jgi:hypothetical protein
MPPQAPQEPEESAIVLAALRAAEPSFAEVWDNDSDSIYDRL